MEFALILTVEELREVAVAVAARCKHLETEIAKRAPAFDNSELENRGDATASVLNKICDLQDALDRSENG
jgi:hypothetical protein